MPIPYTYLLIKTFGVSNFLWIVIFILPPNVLCGIRSQNSIIRNVGQDVIFMWNTTNGNGIVSISWGLLRGGLVSPQFIYISTRSGLKVAARYKGRVSWVGDLNAGHAWFKITNLTIQDTNQYVAEIREQGMKEGTKYPTNLTIATYPQFTLTPPSTRYIAEGQDLSTDCSAVGPPAPDITWLQINGVTVVTKSQGIGSATLSIPNINRNQSGTYECQANNNPNSFPASKQTKIIVMYKPEIDKISSTSIAKSWENHTMQLQCMAKGLPDPSILWHKSNGQLITFGVKNIPGGSRLSVLTTQDSGGYGQYKCRAINVVGYDEHLINVTKIVPPGSSNFTITDDDIQASFIIIAWTKPVSDGGSSVTGYKVKINSTKPPLEKKTSNNHVVFFELTKNTKYLVTVYARNIAGYGKASVKVITTKKQAMAGDKNDQSQEHNTAASGVPVVSVCVVIIVLSVSLNVIQLIVMKKRARTNGKSKNRKTRKSSIDDSVYDNAIEIDDMHSTEDKIPVPHQQKKYREQKHQSSGFGGNNKKPDVQNTESDVNMLPLTRDHYQELIRASTSQDSQSAYESIDPESRRVNIPEDVPVGSHTYAALDTRDSSPEYQKLQTHCDKEREKHK